MIVAGMGLGIKAWRDGVTDTALFDTHLAIGFITVTLAMLQATAVLFRPKHGSALRCSHGIHVKLLLAHTFCSP